MIAKRIRELAAMPELEYELVREKEAKLCGIRVTLLDDKVREHRPKPRTPPPGTGKPMEFPPREPWPTAVDGSALLAGLMKSVQRYLVLPDEAAIALALWVIFTYIIDAADTAPILAIVSPEKRCGKSTLLDWLGRLVSRPLATSNISPAALFRTIEACQPTLLIDEADTFLARNEELRGVLNAGHTRGSAFVIRTVGDDHEPRQYSIWGAKSIALIGELPDTLTDRSVVIEMRRKLPGEKVHKLRGVPERNAVEQLARQCLRYATDSLPLLWNPEPRMPDGLNDRAADNWTPLLAIAEVAGGDWPDRARTAALALSGSKPDEHSTKVQLLSDVRAVFMNLGVDRMASADLLRALLSDPERPWAEFNHGKEMTVRQLARMLGAFGISTSATRLSSGKNLKAYKLKDFDDAFARYLPPIDASQRHTPAPARDSADFASVTGRLCDVPAYPSHTSTGAGCDRVTDANLRRGSKSADDNTKKAA